MMAVGETLDGRYEVLEVHPGGMGVVYILRDLRTGEKHAAKTVKDEYRDDPRVRRRFHREVRTWIRLGRHPHLVEARSVREFGGTPWLFLEYVEGVTLARLLAADGPLLVPQAVDIGLMCALGLSFAHEKPLDGSRGLVHRDVKPENLFLTRDRVAKVSDLGLVKVLAADLDATAEGIGMGTPYYVSPEQLKGSRDVDARADVYSFGAVLFEMLTGEVPLKAESLETQVYRILRDRPDPPSRRNPKVPARLDALAAACLAKDPAERPPDMRVVAGVLRDLLEDPGFRAADAPARTCGRCGYGSAHEPEVCPVCGGETRPGGVFVARSVELHPLRRRQRPVKLTITEVDVRPRRVHVGESLSVTVSIVNHGTSPARSVELPLPVPDPDTFRLPGTEEVWRGTVPPTGGGRPFAVRYHLVPLREGEFVLPPPSVTYEDGQGKHGATRYPEGTELSVLFNYHLPRVDRDEEWAALTEALDGEGAVFVLVEGEAGSGKTRLLDDLQAELAGRGGERRGTEWTVFRGKAMEKAAEPLKCLLDVARQIFGIGSEPLGAGSLLARVIEKLDPLFGRDPSLAAFFAAFLRGAEMPASREGVRGYLWFRLLSALAREKPVVLLLDDLQWADEETIEIAETLVRRAREEGVRLSVVGTTLTRDASELTRTRIAHLRERFAALATNPGYTRRIRLPPLTEEGAGRLLEWVFPGNTLGEDHPWLLPVLVSRSGGNPFLLVQMLRWLREARDPEGEPCVSAEGGAWKLRIDEASLRNRVPEVVEEMVRAMITPLPERQQRLLTVAAAIGEEFEVSLLEAVLGPEAGVEEDLEALEQADLLHSVDRTGERMGFTNTLVPVILSRLDRARSQRARRRLHRSIARAMETVLGRRGLSRAALAYSRHLLLAGERERAFRWLVRAADSLVRRRLFLKADTVLRRATRLREEDLRVPDPVQGTYYYLKGEVCRVTGRLDEALRSFTEALERLEGERGRAELARTMSRMGMVHEMRGEIDRAFYCYQVGAQMREDLGDREGMALSLVHLGSVHLLRGEEEQAEASFRRALDLATEAGSDDARGEALASLAALRAHREEWEAAEELYRESLALAEGRGDPLAAARAVNGLGTLALRRGDLEEAEARFREALAQRTRLGDREGAANTLSNLGVLYDRPGALEGALR